MNFLFVSPNYPPRYFKWVEALHDHGITVLGVGDSPDYDLHPRVRAALTEYRFVKDLNDYSSVLAVAKSYVAKYGPLDFIESDNEWWLFLDAKLREDLNVRTGFWPREMMPIKAKSAMKEKFRAGGAKVARYLLVNGPSDFNDAKNFAHDVGYPLFAKPDIGVGSNDSFPIPDEEALTSFLAKLLPERYILEEFVKGTIVSYDGICDSHSDVVFATSDHFPTPIADIVNKNLDYYYFDNPFSLPFADLDGASFEALGRQVVKNFGIRQRFFHIEFFLLSEDKPGLGKKGEVVALECNMRSPGGFTPDLIDFANSVSCYEIYADVIAYDKNKQDLGKEKYYAIASSRKDAFAYVHPSQEVLTRFAPNICMSGRYPKAMAKAMGDEYYYAKFLNLKDAFSFDAFVREKH